MQSTKNFNNFNKITRVLLGEFIEQVYKNQSYLNLVTMSETKCIKCNRESNVNIGIKLFPSFTCYECWCCSIEAQEQESKDDVVERITKKYYEEKVKNILDDMMNFYEKKLDETFQEF